MTVQTTIAVTIRILQLVLASTTLAIGVYIMGTEYNDFAPVLLAMAASMIAIVYTICLFAPIYLERALFQGVLVSDFVMLALWAGTTGWNGSYFLRAICLGKYLSADSPNYWYNYGNTYSLIWCTWGKVLFGVELAVFILFTTSFLLHIFYVVVPYSGKHSWGEYRKVKGFLSAGAIFRLDSLKGGVNDIPFNEAGTLSHEVILEEEEEVNNVGFDHASISPYEVGAIDSSALKATDTGVSGVKQVSV